MNRARVAQLLRSLADEFDAIDAADRVRQPKAKLAVRAPINPPSELDRARARAALQKLGYRKGKT